MVFFTCSHCGESIKKPSVAKHYQTKCRHQMPFLTCVDCLKDFKGNEYEAHTKCYTEEERYSAKGFVPKASSNKGERKQKAWSECVQGLLSLGNLKHDEKNLLQAIVKFENVPRKKNKFINFINTSVRAFGNKSELIDRVWDKLENYFKESNTDTQQKADTDPDNQPKGDSVDKKGKRKHDETVDDNANEVEKSEKKKKKQKKHSEEAGVNGHEQPTKVGEPEEKAEEGVKTEKETKKKKKSKVKEMNGGCAESKEDKMEVDNHVREETKAEGAGKVQENGKGEASEPAFSWKDTIVSVLSSSGDDSQMTLKKLQKKVLKKYCKVYGCEADEKTVKKFEKKLKKVDGVKINGEIVSLVK